MMSTKKRISLRVSILTIYATTFIVLMATLIILSALNFYHSMFFVSNSLLKDVSDVVLQKVRLELRPAEAITKLSSPLISTSAINDKNIIDYTLHVAENLPRYELPNAARIAAWGDVNGNSVETSLEKDGTFSTAVIKPHANPPLSYRIYRDVAGHVIKKEAISADYDPRLRPWYITATNAKKFTWTDVFLSYPYKNPSTAAVIPIYNAQGQLLGVFEIEVKLVGISDFLTKLNFAKDGTAFIVNGKNELVAFPGMEKWMSQQTQTGTVKMLLVRGLGKPWLTTALDQYNQTHDQHFVFNYNNSPYFANFQDIPEFANYGWKIAVVVPEDSLVGNLERKNALLTLLGIGILLLGIYIASFFSKRISNPLSLLVEETKHIKNFHLTGGKIGESIIKEVDSLADAIYSMKANLRSFQKYMPADLVRQLIKSGKDIEIGGGKKSLTIFFSDIKDFTSISETMDAEQLMLYLCEYLDELSTIITQEKGTIDKYIGDSIMAFWGAPLLDVNHYQDACSAALKCKNRLVELNQKWEKQGKPALNTRFGIHSGEAIVGNIGSSERLNYTALGDAINVASRLEGLNKIYGTTIIVSAEVVKKVGEKFVFRMIDRIAVKGRQGSSEIYELLAENPDQLSFDLTAYRTAFEQGMNDYDHQRWESAISHFKDCLKLYPADTVAPIFISRCESFIKNPPPHNWDGTWRALEK